MNPRQTAAALRAAAEIIEQSEPSVRWEYKMLPKQGQPISAEELNELGQEGWRLVTLTKDEFLDPLGRAWIAYLMRAAEA